MAMMTGHIAKFTQIDLQNFHRLAEASY